MQFKSVKINLKLPIIGSIEGTWEPNDVQRQAAWEMYVELVTRISVNELKTGEGLLREALTSLYSLFNSTREILKKYGPEVAISTKGNISFGYLAVSILNTSLRPLLAKWHPLLLEYENKRSESVSLVEHEKEWDKFNELKTVLEEIRQILVEYAEILGQVAGVPSLIIER
ncbi:hypothetical protein [Bacillus pseudomycoides]|nr:hypothetical protein [Bacillus pseudomycoides]MED1535670.1 hypothetical protein [Bacillus pseudomycoides]